jgi:hypothetical protein
MPRVQRHQSFGGVVGDRAGAGVEAGGPVGASTRLGDPGDLDIMDTAGGGDAIGATGIRAPVAGGRINAAAGDSTAAVHPGKNAIAVRSGRVD